MTSDTSHISTNYFAGAHQFNIERLEINHIGRQALDIGQQPLTANHDPSEPILDASYLRNRKTSPPDSNCLAGTRRAIIDSILSWASDSTPSGLTKHICWLYGYVGCGKSAIAQTIAEKFAAEERLAASFFFFRGSGDRSTTRRLASSILHQMQSSIPAMEPLVQAVLKKHPGVYTFRLETQFRLLIYEPFQAATRSELLGRTSSTSLSVFPYLIVIDGVDECEDRDEIMAWMYQMVTYFDNHPTIPLRFFISSRVQEHIRDSLNSPRVTMINLVDHCPRDDIIRVTGESFDSAARFNRVIRSYGPGWPTTDQKRLLMNHAGGSFVFLSTLLKYVLEPGADHKKRLSLALNLNPGLDGLYSETLSLSQHFPHFTSVISSIALLCKPLSISGLAELLEIHSFEVVQILVNLHAILQVPGDDFDPVTLCHSSLYEFLTTEGRSKQFFVPRSHHKFLFERCFQLLCAPANPLHGKQSAAAKAYATEYVTNHFFRYWRTLEDDAEAKDNFVDAVSLAIRNQDPDLFESAITLVLLTRENYLSLPEGTIRTFSEILQGPLRQIDAPTSETYRELLSLIQRYHPTAWRRGYRDLVGPTSQLKVLKSFASTIIWERAWLSIVIVPFPDAGWRFYLHRYIRAFWVHHVYMALGGEDNNVLAAALSEQVDPLPVSTEHWGQSWPKGGSDPEYRRVNDWITLDEELRSSLPGYSVASADWRWEKGLGPTRYASECYFLSRPSNQSATTLLSVIAGYTQLALCMSYACQHGDNGGVLCPPKRFKDGRPYPIPEV